MASPRIIGRLDENRLISARANYREQLRVQLGSYDGSELFRISKNQPYLISFIEEYIRWGHPVLKIQFDEACRAAESKLTQ
jgi:hypothetical protein